MQKKTHANVLIYSLVLVNLALILALAMFNNFFVFLASTEWNNIEKRLSKSITNTAGLYAKQIRKLNTNGSGFIDTLGCPSVTMSGTTSWSSAPSTFSTSLSYTWSNAFPEKIMLCVWNYNAQELRVLFNNEFTSFSWAELGTGSVVLIGWNGNSTFNDAEQTQISNVTAEPADGFDDNFNDDNYSLNGSGSTVYPWWYIDDDWIVKLQVYGYISPDAGSTNAFWSNSKASRYIQNNPNNTWSLGYIGSGTLNMYLNADRDMELKIVEFDKTAYDTQNALIVSKTIQTALDAQEWFIQTDGTDLSLSGQILSDGLQRTGNELVFDYENKDYAIFINNTGTGILTYSLQAFTIAWERVYINPINDSSPNTIRYLGSDIIQETSWNYIGKTVEIYNEK